MPLASAELEYVHDPLLRVQVLSVVEPSCSVTLPVGVPPDPLTLIVHVTECPTMAGLLELVRVVVVGARVAFTTCTTVALEPEYTLSPPYWRVIVCEPTARLEMLVEQLPLTSVQFARGVEFSRNTRVPVGVPEEPLTTPVIVAALPKSDGFGELDAAIVEAGFAETISVIVELLEPRYVTSSPE